MIAAEYNNVFCFGETEADAISELVDRFDDVAKFPEYFITFYATKPVSEVMADLLLEEALERACEDVDFEYGDGPRLHMTDERRAALRAIIVDALDYDPPVTTHVIGHNVNAIVVDEDGTWSAR